MEGFVGAAHASVMLMVQVVIEVCEHPKDVISKFLLDEATASSNSERVTSVKEKPDIPAQQKVTVTHVRMTQEPLIDGDGVDLSSAVRQRLGEAVIPVPDNGQQTSTAAMEKVDRVTEGIRLTKDQRINDESALNKLDPSGKISETEYVENGVCESGDDTMTGTATTSWERWREKRIQRRKQHKLKQKQRKLESLQISDPGDTNTTNDNSYTLNRQMLRQPMENLVSSFLHGVTGDRGFGGLIMIFFLVEGFIRNSWHIWLPAAMLVLFLFLPSRSVQWLPTFNDPRSQMLQTEVEELSKELDLGTMLEFDQTVGIDSGPAAYSPENLLRGRSVWCPGEDENTNEPYKRAIWRVNAHQGSSKAYTATYFGVMVLLFKYFSNVDMTTTVVVSGMFYYAYCVYF